MKRAWLTLLFLGLGLAAWLATARGAVSGAHPPRPAVHGRAASSHLWVSPLSLGARLPVWVGPEQEVRQDEILTVGNDGLSTSLEYTVTVVPTQWRMGIVTWLAVTPTRGTLAPGQEVPITVSWAPQEGMPGGLYAATVYVESDSLSEPVTMPVPVTLELLDAVLHVDPPSLSASLLAGQILSLPVTLHNLASVTATVSAAAQGPAPWLSGMPAGGPLPGGAQGTLWAVLDARGLVPGAYLGSLVVESDLLPGATTIVPVRLDVSKWACFLPTLLRSSPGGP